MNADLLGLLAQAKEQPDEALPRLLLADWLEDHGQPQRAEFARLQVARHQLEEASHFWAAASRRERVYETLRESEHWRDAFGRAEGAPARAEREGMLARERALLEAHEADWLGGLLELPIAGWGWDRGMVSIRLAGARLLGREFRSRAASEALPWVDGLVLEGQTVEELRSCLRSPLLAEVSSLSLRRAETGQAGLRVLAECERLVNLRSLAIIASASGARQPRALAELRDAPFLPQLSALEVASGPLGPEGLGELLRSGRLAALARLALPGISGANEGGFGSWVDGPQLLGLFHPPPPVPRLADLDLASGRLTYLLRAPDGTPMGQMPFLRQLTRLDLSDLHVHDEHGGYLAPVLGSEHLAGLEYLHVGGNALDAEECDALLNSKHLGALRVLVVGLHHQCLGRLPLLRQRFPVVVS